MSIHVVIVIVTVVGVIVAIVIGVVVCTLIRIVVVVKIVIRLLAVDIRLVVVRVTVLISGVIFDRVTNFTSVSVRICERRRHTLPPSNRRHTIDCLFGHWQLGPAISNNAIT